ncbi:putative ribose operon repressor-like [Daphnia sinensis]|uniref:Ribose operon repressor-like n=1 Tax=Daphnia sinensis TaxID=1820382 RepID=A0AAD5KCZ4_9CRUS|nr:putative ribose operon repressor-like [Daphnia sinensis]
MDPDAAISLTCEQDEESNIELIREMLQAPDRPDGILASVEKLALATYHAVKRTDLRIPKDLKIISFSNMKIASLLNPSLTTITQPAFTIGEECAKLLIKKLTRPKQPDLLNQVITIPSKITIRASTMAE